MTTTAQVKAQVERIWQQTYHSALGGRLAEQLRAHTLEGVRQALEAVLREEVAAYRATTASPGLRLSGSYRR